MNAAPTMFDIGAIPLGYVGNVASWRRPVAAQAERWQPMVIIQICSDTDENGHTPASCVTVQGRYSLLALREAVNKALGEEAA